VPALLRQNSQPLIKLSVSNANAVNIGSKRATTLPAHFLLAALIIRLVRSFFIGRVPALELSGTFILDLLEAPTSGFLMLPAAKRCAVKPDLYRKSPK
jgi:hypothetical protein